MTKQCWHVRSVSHGGYNHYYPEPYATEQECADYISTLPWAEHERPKPVDMFSNVLEYCMSCQTSTV